MAAQPPFLGFANYGELPTAVVTCTEAGESAKDLLTRWLDEPLLTASAADTTIDVDWGGAAVDGVAAVCLYGVNWTAAQSLRMRFSGSYPWDAGDVTWDTTSIPGLPTYRITPQVPYPPDLLRSRTFVRTAASGGLLVPAPVDGVRSLRMELTGGVEPWSIGVLWIGPLWSPEEALSPVNDREVVDLSSASPTSWGSVTGEHVGAQYVETLQVAFQRHADTVNWANLLATTGQLNPFLLVRDPSSIDEPRDRYSEPGLRRRDGAEVRLPALVALGQTGGLDDAAEVSEMRLVPWR